MATARLRPLSERDKEEIGNVIQSLSGIENIASVRDMTIDDKSSLYSSSSSHHTRSLIKLVVPTFNFVLGRSGMTLLWKVLGVSKAIYDGIISCDIVYDIVNDELININEAIPGHNYKYMAEIAEDMISKLDIEERKLECLYSALGKFCSSNHSPKECFLINREAAGGFHLVDGYYAHITADTKGVLKRNTTIEDIQLDYAKTIFPNSDSAYSYLCNMNPDKSGLYGMLNYSIVVLPEEMHPVIDKRKHKLTKRYEYVIKANNELYASLASGANPNELSIAHKALNNAVSKLQYKLQGTGSDVKKDDLSVLERVKGKEGQIRKNNLGKRQDYSGRAVVVINPFLPLDVIRVPKTMLPVLLEYHALPYLAAGIRKNVYNQNHNQHVANVFDRIKLSNLRSSTAREQISKIIKHEKLLDKVPIVMGRQPTLHKQSLQAFHIEESEYQAIEVNPLVCPAYNMDFDGDQGHLEVPLSDEAIREVNDLLLTTQNLFLAKTGSCTTEPRQDMLYGLYVCTRDTYVVGQYQTNLIFESYEDVRQAVMNHKVKVWETVGVLEGGGGQVLAGDAALIACYPPGVLQPRGHQGRGFAVQPFYKKTLSDYMELILATDSDGNFLYPIGEKRASNCTFVGVINRLVELGFKVARLYPVNMTLMLPGVTLSYEYAKSLGYNVNPVKKTNGTEFTIQGELDNFHEAMSELDLLYNLGLETDDNYRLEFDKNLDVLSNEMSTYMTKALGEMNGYVQLSVSGARGSSDNLNQAFAYKGRVKKNSTESFDALLENSYASQMTPLEGFVAAYGGRQGQIDKSLKTGDTGYAMRQMWHATQGLVITCEDCGTPTGITLNKKELTLFSDSENEDAIKKDVEELFAYTITGRYRVGTNRMISAAEAKQLAKDPKVTSISIRSPLTCSNPCCAKCFGTDWSTRKKVVIGTPVGIVAAQSIGEPGTQLTLKQFQKGGVAGKAEVTSAFDKVSNYIHLSNLADKWRKGKYPGYDPVAWASGKVVETPASTLGMKRITIEGSKGKSIIVPNDTIFKEEAIKGEGLAYKHGDYDISELIRYAGLQNAQFYLVFKLFSLYKSEVKIRPIHFEVLVASMLRFMIISTDRSDLMVGQYCTRHELFSGNITNTKFEARLVGVKKLTEASMDALDAIVMESQGEGLSRTCLLGLSDSLTKPLNRMMLGLTITCGSNVPGFIENRKETI